MISITLANSGITTSRLGFGCVSLTMHSDRAAAQRVLAAAYDSGIRHFDVARLYGFGQCEGILGSFLGDKPRDQITIATKFGLEPTGAASKSRKLMSIARWVVRRSNFLLKLARRSTQGAVAAGKFTPDDAKRMLETSMRELQTDYIDLYLLHEAERSEANNEDLVAFLQAQVARGTIRAFGPAGEYHKLGNDAALLNPAHTLVQFGSSTLEPNIRHLANTAGRDLVTFAPISAVKLLADTAKSRPELQRQWQGELGCSPTDTSALAGLFLADALASNPSGIVLFASTHAERITKNIDASLQPYPAARSASFTRLVRELRQLAAPVASDAGPKAASGRRQ